jgi:CDP-diacylglycerol--glycerol-3-phosphate 3-phosphatidyltransferase
MTTANKITLGRLLLIPFFVAQVLYYGRTGEEWFRFGALVTFAVAAISDGIDGYIARRYNQRSELGAILDPLADKLLLASGVVLLSFPLGGHVTQLPLWLVLVIVSRDAGITGWLLLMRYLRHHAVIRPRWISKIATVLQMAIILWNLLKWDVTALWWLCVTCAVLTGVSGFIYLADGARQLSRSPASAASEPEAKS